MKYFLAAIVTAALLSDIIPVWAAADSDKANNAAPTVQTEASDTLPDSGISITPQAQAKTQAGTKAKITATQPQAPAAGKNATAQADTHSNQTVTTGTEEAATTAQPPQPVIQKIQPPVPQEKPLRVVWPQDFYYYAYNGEPYYSLLLPKDFGSDTIAGLPAVGPMLMRAQSNIVMLTFDAAASDPAKARVFSDAVKNRVQIPLPPLGPNQEYAYIPAPRYNYYTDTAPLELPKQITNAKIVDAGTWRTAENLPVQYLLLSCYADGQHCMAALTRSERSGKAFEGLFIFPYAEKHNYLPLVSHTAQSLRVRK